MESKIRKKHRQILTATQSLCSYFNEIKFKAKTLRKKKMTSTKVHYIVKKGFIHQEGNQSKLYSFNQVASGCI